MKTVIRNLIYKGEQVDIAFENGIILDFGKNISGEFDKEENGNGLNILPCFVDMHFHLRNPGFENKQTYEEASEAAVKGGYRLVVAMGNTKPTADNEEVIKTVEKAMEKLPLKVKQIATVSKELKGQEIVDFENLRKYTNIFSDDGKNVDNPEIMKEALKKSKELDFVILDHDEPETEMVIRNLELVRETDGRMHFCHISKKQSMEAIVKAKEEGLNVTVEVTPHHLFSSNLSYRVNPPIATEEDRLFLIESIKNNHVNVIGTDHAPHTEEDKEKGAPGIINIETAFPMVWKVFYENGISLDTLENLMSIEPGKMLGVDTRLIPGNEASFILFRDEETKIDKNSFVTRSKNTPYDGWDIRGIIEKTYIKGEVEYGIR